MEHEKNMAIIKQALNQAIITEAGTILYEKERMCRIALCDKAACPIFKECCNEVDPNRTESIEIAKKIIAWAAKNPEI